MTAKLINGNEVAQQIREELKQRQHPLIDVNYISPLTTITLPWCQGV